MTTTPSTSTTDQTPAKTETALVHVNNSQQTKTGGLCCYSCGETGHRQSASPSKTQRGLLIEEAQEEQDPIYDEEQASEEEELYPDSGQLLLVRRSCLSPKVEAQFPQRNKLFQSRCTISRKVCYFVIDSGSSENVIAADAVTKLQLKEEPAL